MRHAPPDHAELRALFERVRLVGRDAIEVEFPEVASLSLTCSILIKLVDAYWFLSPRL